MSDKIMVYDAAILTHDLSVEHSLEVSERKVSRVWNLAAMTSGSNTSKGNSEQRDEKSELHGLRGDVGVSCRGNNTVGQVVLIQLSP
jgi:hypothetical protein